MSREFKFRSWNKEAKYMVQDPTSMGSIMRDHIRKSFDLNGKLIGENDVVMQFTGLKDDNGVDVFEGDLVKFNDREIIYEVIWDEYRLAWWLMDVKAGKRELSRDTDYQQLLNNVWQQRVVIGNIYENSELLGVEK